MYFLDANDWTLDLTPHERACHFILLYYSVEDTDIMIMSVKFWTSSLTILIGSDLLHLVILYRKKRMKCFIVLTYLNFSLPLKL